MSRYQKAKAILLATFGLQILIVVPVFLGAIYRHEWPMWVWQVSLNKHGLGDILFGGYFYLLFYSGLFVIPFALVFLWWACNSRYITEQFPGKEAVMLSVWIGATCFLFPDSVMEFIRHLPWGGPSEWLIIGWTAGGLYVVYAFGKFHKREHAREGKQIVG